MKRKMEQKTSSSEGKPPKEEGVCPGAGAGAEV